MLTRLAMACLLGAASLGGLWAVHRHVYTQGYDAGVEHERHEAREAQQQRLHDDRRLAEQLTSAARPQLQRLDDHAQQLRQEIRRASPHLIVAPAPAVCAAAAVPAAVADAAGPPASAGGAGLRAGAEALRPSMGPGLLDGRSPRLSGDALRLWDSAIAGVHVPGGACGADGGAAEACAAATEYSIEDAFDNHSENSRRCNANRLRHEQLIEFLRARAASESHPKRIHP